MKILLLSTYDLAGGAEKIAFNLLKQYQELGHDTRMLVSNKKTQENNIYEVDFYENGALWAPLCKALENKIRLLPKFRGQARIINWLRKTGIPKRWLDYWVGIESFNYPYSYNLLNDANWKPDIIHAHNLHGEYFDLKSLPFLSSKVPIVWTLHDAWALTGHCAHFQDIDCNRWIIGCGKCPDLNRYPRIRYDNTKKNWENKNKIYSNSKLAIATPSRWLMELVDQSMLKICNRKVINNGIDISIFKTGEKSKARAKLGLPQDVFICMTAAQSVNTSNPFKDFKTIIETANKLNDLKIKTKILFVCVGKNTDSNLLSNFHYTGFISDANEMAMYYQAADLLLHAAFIDNFPGVILESLCCGTPVIASDVGGIPDIIKHGTTGFLVPKQNSKAMANQIVKLLNNPSLLNRISKAASEDAKTLFSLNTQAEKYVKWFNELKLSYPKK